jgi:exodeoxyribonuclease V alpha subunit
VALTAPTGKAAARLQEAVLGAALQGPDKDRLAGLQAMTLHRLLGSRRDNGTRFRHDRGNRLPHDVIVVDETSMVSLTMMARLVEAVRPDARLLLVGDADQLASVDAGAVLADLVAGLSDELVVSLATNHRSERDIVELADAIRVGAAERALTLLTSASDQLDLHTPDDAASVLRGPLTEAALRIRTAAEAGDPEAALAALDAHRLLCAHREGPFGVRRWNRLVEQWISEATGDPLWDPWYVGRPVLVTANDYGLGVYNGDVGVAVRAADGRLRVHLRGAEGLMDFAPSRLDDVQTMHAMTIHKAQGGQADRVTVLLPDESSRLLSRELFYTAVTRARHHVTVVGSTGSVQQAVVRRAVRATGLRHRLA